MIPGSDEVRAAPAIDAVFIPKAWRFAVASTIDWPPRRSLLARLLALL